MHHATNHPWDRFILFCLLIFSISCSQVRLIQEYDEVTDRQITSMQEKFARFFVKMRKQAGMPEGNYVKYESFYDDVRTQLNVLEVRNRAIPRTDITNDIISSLAKEVDLLENLHRMGFTTYDEVIPVKYAMESSFAAMLKFQLALKSRIK